MVEVVHWNPSRRPTAGPLRRLRRPRPVDNFGDLLGPVIVGEILQRRGLDPRAGAQFRLLAVGSILTMTRPGDVVWGCGVNGKHLHHEHVVSDVSFRAVRGPRSATFLRGLGAEVPDIFGDPGLLVAELWPDPGVSPSQDAAGLLLAPNLHDFPRLKRQGYRVLDPTGPMFECLRQIASSEFVVASSLHAAIVADAYGVPARLLKSHHEPEFKYQDYLEGTGRFGVTVAANVEEACALGPHPALDWSSELLLDSFPEELWH